MSDPDYGSLVIGVVMILTGIAFATRTFWEMAKPPEKRGGWDTDPDLLKFPLGFIAVGLIWVAAYYRSLQ